MRSAFAISAGITLLGLPLLLFLPSRGR
jgi:hypothetical protein